MRILKVSPQIGLILSIIADDGRVGEFDVKPYLEYEAFEPLKSIEEFMQVTTGGYFIKWNCGADLSADTIEAHWKVNKPA